MQTFVNFESAQVHPVELTPDGATLLVTNTADDRLEVFSLVGGIPVARGSVPVGLEPVSVRARDSGVAFVVNHLSDSISIVDLATLRVTRTVRVGDEPADVVFAGSPLRAFVSLSQENRIAVFDAAAPGAALASIPVGGEDPRALATDGTRVFAAVFEAGNRTTVIDFQSVSQFDGPYNGVNPPPNSGLLFNPPQAQVFPLAPRVGQIVRRNSGGQWLDDNGRNWSSKVLWGVDDRDVAIIDVATLGVTQATDLLSANMQLAVRPDGRVSVIGLDATNEKRFEPNLNGRFVRVRMCDFPATNPASVRRFDLNPHLTYAGSSIPAGQRSQSIGDPRGIAWKPAGDRGLVTGMGSNNVVVTNADGARVGLIPVGQGPTGVVIAGATNRAYVLNRFDATISVIDVAALSELTRVAFFDPTPAVIRAGRPMLYDTHRTSGTGHLSCATCHIDGRTDALAWDLGNPAGAVKTFNQTCNSFNGQGCENWHPMKGPMATQSLVGIINGEALHWRGDREDLPAFAPAFVGLLGDDATPGAADMAAFEAFVATIRRGPNPHRNFDDSLRAALTIDDGTRGDAALGKQLFQTIQFQNANVSCVECHQFPTGGADNIIAGPILREPQSFQVAPLGDVFEKVGLDRTRPNNTRGIGFLHDGIDGTLVDFLSADVFLFDSLQQRRDVAAFLLSFPTESHPSVGRQVTLDATNNQSNSSAVQTVQEFMSYADQGLLGLVVKGIRFGQPRGWRYLGGGAYQSDRLSESLTFDALRVAAATGAEITFTLVPAGTETRAGCDRDEDGFLDRDETDYCADPANAASLPRLKGDMNYDGAVNAMDIAAFVGQIVQPAGGAELRCIADFNRDGRLDGDDIPLMVSCLSGDCPAPPQLGAPPAAVDQSIPPLSISTAPADGAERLSIRPEFIGH